MNANSYWILLSIALFVILWQAAIDVSYRNDVVLEREELMQRIDDLETQNSEYMIERAMYDCEIPCDELERMVEASELLAQAWWRQATHCIGDINRIRIGGP